jgi:hypothetical protein
VRVRTPNENFVFVQREFGNPKSSCETFWALFFSDAHVIGKYACGALVALVLRTSRLLACVVYVTQLNNNLSNKQKTSAINDKKESLGETKSLIKKYQPQ